MGWHMRSFTSVAYLGSNIAGQVRIPILGPCASNAVALFVYVEILMVQQPLKLDTHCNSRHSAADDGNLVGRARITAGSTHLDNGLRCRVCG